MKAHIREIEILQHMSSITGNEEYLLTPSTDARDMRRISYDSVICNYLWTSPMIINAFDQRYSV